MVLPNPIASLVLEDLRRAACYLDELADEPNPTVNAATAHGHAVRLWSASQAVERLVVAVEQLVVMERSRLAWGQSRETS
jgi:hypothetical protein